WDISGSGAASGFISLGVDNLFLDGNTLDTISGDLTLSSFSGNINLLGTTTLSGVTYTWPGADAALSGYVLSSNGSGQLSWIDITSATTQYWDQANGTLFPTNSTTDFFIGGSASDSAKFAVININSGIP